MSAPHESAPQASQGSFFYHVDAKKYRLYFPTNVIFAASFLPVLLAVRRECRGRVLRGQDAGTDRFLPDVVPGLVVGVIGVDSVIALLGDFRRRGEGHTSLEAT